PVRIIGNIISILEKSLIDTFGQGKKAKYAEGIVLALVVCILCGAVPWVLVVIAFNIHGIVALILMSVMCYFMLATKALRDESMKVYDALVNGSLEDSRRAVSMIVGRDTKNLDREGIIKATVETIAENFSDGVFAPIMYMAFGGPVLLYLYKGINTMDSMIGYKNDKYMYFGRFAAKLDDVANFIPSRMAGIILVVAAAFCKMDYKNAWKIFLRDRNNHASPNSAQTEAAVAGALGVQLAGNAYYFGKLFEKPTIGDPIREIEADDIVKANKLMYVASAISLIFCIAVLIGSGIAVDYLFFV
ncbi:MAG: adenosylcobinamide-phosphate synthase CbiB, partial [Bacillota bacterium]|nr:adenosylcobinamide-phosphate synthase CbiB [Bacillota bacterium]